MKITDKKFVFEGEELTIGFGKYESTHNTAMVLVDAWERPYATVTVNIDECPLPESMLVCKTWSENEDLFNELVKQEILIPTSMVIPCGYSTAVVCRLNPSYKG